MHFSSQESFLTLNKVLFIFSISAML